MDEDLDDIIGVVLRSTILEISNEGNTDKKMSEITSNLSTVSPEDSVATLLDEFLKKKEHIFLVVDEHGATQGIITLEDAVETLLGAEIVDESDSVEDKYIPVYTLSDDVSWDPSNWILLIVDELEETLPVNVIS